MIDKYLLFPYYLVLKFRNAYYKRRASKLFSAEVPTLCIGNVTVGGTGKTPHVEMVLNMLGESEEWSSKQLAVLSRGYLRESEGFQQVVGEGSAKSFGDEPMQIKRKFPNVVVAVDKDRVQACKLLTHPEKLTKTGLLSRRRAPECWHREFPAADYIVLDDAYQYRKLRPTKSVVLINYTRPTHKDMLLPLGRLRDLHERIFDADALIISKSPVGISDEQKKQFVLDLGFSSYDALTHKAVNQEGNCQLVLFSHIEYLEPKGVYKTSESRFNYSSKAILLTGIANDIPLRRYLSDTYKIVRRFSLPDHHSFNWEDIQSIKKALRRYPTAVIITTEKDAQRLLDFVGMPPEISERLHYIPIKTRFSDESEKADFANFIV